MTDVRIKKEDERGTNGKKNRWKENRTGKTRNERRNESGR